jgi:protein-S-isoprenylcysteine O-methyltransferase Ste14
MRWRVRLGYPLAILFLWLAQPSPASILQGAALALAGLAVRAAAAGALRKQEELATGGIYAHTRNPLYFGSALLAAGFIWTARSWWVAVCAAVYFAVFYSAVMKREEGELQARFGDEFRAYAREVPLFFPRLTPVKRERKQGRAFSWQQYARNREWRAALGTLLVIALLFAKMKWLSY